MRGSELCHQITFDRNKMLPRLHMLLWGKFIHVNVSLDFRTKTIQTKSTLLKKIIVNTLRHEIDKGIFMPNKDFCFDILSKYG